ncbi:winged helix-turn-helix transcriptional regulator [Rhizobium halophytocola]|uniref:DNA-binding HxlR family transcriptional regulator n=1 Tax=Rhizobium halophytocola TaxID=735519 RepID=A0ABS4E5W5_9HYPH|nr:helix-turn-helix domain-containing protein [Rhizobium halophytocola]MBP1853303.1 DNA-binding HxlR family transcriptional regulator [Rhizobium halophytocola]
MRQAPRSLCPISLALELFGDSWSLLIVRDLMFKGIDSYAGFLEAGEGIATNILADRLKRLADDGLIEALPDETDKRRRRYRLTDKGLDLAPVMTALVLWSAKHTGTDAPAEQVCAMAADPDGFARGVVARHRAARSA